MKDKVKDILFRLSIFGMLFVVPIVNSCCEAEASNTQTTTTTKSVVIRNVEQVDVKGSGLRFTFFKFDYEGHEYFCVPQSDTYIMHSPNCSCLKEAKVESSSIFDSSPSNSLFDW